MRRATGTLAATFLASIVCAGMLSAAAQAQIAWKPCGDSNEFACGHLTVPVDPSGGVPGTITLAMRRHLSPLANSKSAVIALAGGPGQSAIPFANQFAQMLGPIVSTRDLIAFDQRGTGLSNPLSCPAFEHLHSELSATAVAICAGQIGATRGLYTTADTVADIEAIRQAGGYEKLVLYGTSYGTKVAELYAQEYPSHVEALVLDSVVPPEGPEPFDKTTFTAVGRVLRQLCRADACAHITPEPVRDLARLVKRMGGESLRGRAVNGDGVGFPVQISSNDLLGILMDGDFDPILRAEFPAAVRSAVAGDTAPLARLIARTGESESEEEGLAEGFDTPLYYATICNETVFPWNRSSSPQSRLGEAVASLRAQPASAFAPFTSANALALSDVPDCAAWPFTAPGPEVDDAPLPNVPTLILSGEDDLRTPTANARVVAKEIPDASLLVVPNTGHSVLGSDPTPCSQDALQALFAGKPVKRCADRKPPSYALPTPLPPRRLSEVPIPRGSGGLPGRTLGAAVLTIADFDRQLALAIGGQSEAEIPSGTATVRAGGLLAGWGGIVHDTTALHGYSYVPGVTLSGTVSVDSTTLRIGGSAAARGTITLSGHGTITGVLAGHHVRLSAAGAAQTENASSVLALPARVQSLLANPAHLIALRAQGTSALLSYVLGARP
ncbi:MAG TPA: alpha/beta fold hydrolase [Solirubrobacteraceae bacterium]